MRPLILPNTSSPLPPPYFATAATREASWARAEEWCFWASLFTRETTFWPVARALADAEEDSCRKLCSAAPPVLSWMIFFASPMTLSSSARAATLASWSLAVTRQVVWTVSSSLTPCASAFVVASRSPVAVAFASSAAAFADFSSARSLFSLAILSSRPCFSISKPFLAAVSPLRRLPSSSSALASMSSSTSTMPPLCDLYAAAAGAPSSSSSLSSEVCARATSFWRSEVLKEAASSTAPRPTRAVRMLEVSICAKEAPLDVCSLMILMARERASTASIISFSLAAKSAASFSRIPVAFLRSSELSEMEAASLAISVSLTWMSLVFSPIFASSFAFSSVDVLMANCEFLEASSHHSKYSW
mmetsp:Transcript_19869/g.52730  ORF Transcript_19869/g.52730 Transcript_19869/m.52730 type:complete len:360 (+) Transcript_19869:2-1081(+)